MILNNDEATARGVVIAALLSQDDGVPEVHLEGIWNECRSAILGYGIWKLVLDGSLAVQWNPETGDCQFSKVPVEEVGVRRSRIRRAILLKGGSR